MGCGSSAQASHMVPRHAQQPAEDATQEERTERETFQPFTEFPTPQLLRDANEKYAALQRPLPRDETGKFLPYPSVTPKSSLFDLEKFQAVDKFAVEVQPIKYDISLQEFTDYLTGTWSNDEMAKVRVIMRWLAAQRPDQLKKLKCSDRNSTLAKLLATSDTDLFLEMCQCAGMQAEKIFGYSKHARLEVGEEPSSNNLHSWVAVVINQEWRLVDPHWCCSSVTGLGSAGWSLVAHDVGSAQDTTQGEEERVVYILDEDYFLTNPEEFIYTHFPRDDEAWQFLSRPVTFREFVDIAYLKPAFFELDIRLLEVQKCVLYAPQGEIEIKLGTPLNATREFRYQLWMSDRQKIGDVKLERYCIMEQKDNTLICKIRFPVAGKFKHKLYGRSADIQYGATSFSMLCAFIIHCEQPAEDAKALPENVRQEWGPGKDLARAGLVPITHPDAVIQAAEGAVELRFQTTKPVELRHTLHSDNKTKAELQGNVIHYIDNGEVVFNIQLPEDGDYALNLFNKSEGPQKSLCSYVVSSANTAPDNQGFAIVPDGRVGVAANNDVEIKLISHNSPIIECSKDGCMELKFTTSELCKVLPKLELVTEEGNVLKEGFVWTEYNDSKKEITFKINFPESGRYVFNLHAKEEGKDGDFTRGYTCVMKVAAPKQGCVPFPERYSAWGRNCKLGEPVAGTVTAESSVHFVVDVPDANHVAVFGSQNDKTSLSKNGQGVWQADVETGEYDHELELRAKTKKDSSSYTPLLKYQVEDTELLKKQRELRREREEAARREEEARKEMIRQQFEKAKQQLQTAVDSRDVEAVRAAIRYVENVNFSLLLAEEVEAAKQLLKSVERIQALKEAVLKLDQKTMLELRNYSKPPKIVHQVIKATLLLLGYNESLITKWSDCQKRLVTFGRHGLFRQIRSFDVTVLVPCPQLAFQAFSLIGRYRREQVSFVSTGAEVFYSWTIGMIQEFRNANPSVACKTPS